MKCITEINDTNKGDAKLKRKDDLSSMFKNYKNTVYHGKEKVPTLDGIKFDTIEDFVIHPTFKSLK